FFSHASSTPAIHHLSLHDALPISRQTTPDYVTGCTDEFERQYAPGRSKTNAPHSPETLSEAFKKSEYQTLLDSEMAEYKASLEQDRKSTRLNSSHVQISYAVFCLK